MKLSMAALSILMVFCSLAFSAPIGPNTVTPCCLSYMSQQIPREIVTGHYVINSVCSQPAVVFETKEGKLVCANPSDAWVKSYVEDLELKRGAQGMLDVDS